VETNFLKLIREKKTKKIEKEKNERKNEQKSNRHIMKKVVQGDRQNYETTNIMRRSNSCRNLSWERVTSELDEETLENISASKQSALKMFESATPKYKFGGSVENVKTLSSREQSLQKTKSAQKDIDGRKWVLESINKHFDVILEEGEDLSDSAHEDYASEEDWPEVEPDEKVNEEPKMYTEPKSSSQMQGLLKSVVSKITKSYSNLSDKDVISGLKSQLEQR